MPKHKEEEKFWGYLIAPDKSPTPLFEALLMGISHYIITDVAPWETKTLTPSKMAHFYRLVGGNYDSLFLESPNASIAFIYKSLGCYHSLQPTRDPFKAPSIPALTNDGFVRWQTVQLLLGPEEHVPFIQECVKRFEIKNPIHGGYFPRFLPAEALPRVPDAEMTRWHDQVGERLLRESGAAGSASIADSRPSLEDQPLTDAGPYVHSPPAGAAERDRPDSFGQATGPPGAGERVPRHEPGLQAPPSYIRRHSVPDRARGEFAPDKPTRVFSSPTSAEPVYPANGAPATRYHSHDAALKDVPGVSSPQATSKRQEASHRRSSSSTSPRRPQGHRSKSHDRPGSISHSRSPPRMGQVPEQAPSHPQAPFPSPSQYQPQPRPPLSATDPGRRHTLFNAKDYPPPQSHARVGSGVVDASGRVIYPMAPPQYYPPPASAGRTGGPSPPQPGVSNAMPAGMQGSSPPSRQTHFPAPAPPSAGAGAIPIRPHPPPPASSPIGPGGAPPPNTPYTRPPPSRHPAASAAMRPSSSSSEPPLPPPNPAPAAAQASMVPPPSSSGVRFAQDPEIRAGGANGERSRRRTVEEAREQERARDEMEFEYGRRRQRPLAGSGPTSQAARRSRSRGDRPEG